MGQVFSVAWSPDGQRLAIASFEFASGEPRGVVRLFRQDGMLAATLTTDGGGGKFLPLVWSPDGTMLAAGLSHDGIGIWRRDGTPLTTLAGCPGVIRVVAWSPDGRHIAGGSVETVVCLWQAEFAARP